MIAEPVLLPAVKPTVAVVAPVAVAVPIVGAPGTAFGVMELEAAEASELPAALVAVMVKV